MLHLLLLSSSFLSLTSRPHAPGSCRARLCSSGDDEWLNSQPDDSFADALEDAFEDAQLLKRGRKGYKAPKDNRDALLYKVTEISPPPKKLGTFRLPPNAGCGDIICAPVRLDGEAEKSEQTFVIKKVSYRYAYQSGRYVMVGKEAGVKKASRDATDAFLQRMLPDESGLELE